MNVMAKDSEEFAGFGRYAGPATLILASLADGTKHGYALTKDIESFAGVRLAPGTLYEALARLEAQGMIEGVESHDRRRPYRLTAAGATALRAHLDHQRRVAGIAAIDEIAVISCCDRLSVHGRTLALHAHPRQPAERRPGGGRCIDDAFALLRSYAFTSGTELAEVAAAVVERRLDLSDG